MIKKRTKARQIQNKCKKIKTNYIMITMIFYKLMIKVEISLWGEEKFQIKKPVQMKM